MQKPTPWTRKLCSFASLFYRTPECEQISSPLLSVLVDLLGKLALWLRGFNEGIYRVDNYCHKMKISICFAGQFWQFYVIFQLFLCVLFVGECDRMLL